MGGKYETRPGRQIGWLRLWSFSRYSFRYACFWWHATNALGFTHLYEDCSYRSILKTPRSVWQLSVYVDCSHAISS